MVDVMDRLHHAGEGSENVRAAVENLHSDAKELRDTSPDLRKKADILLARMQAQDHVASLLRRDDLGPGQKLPLLVNALGGISLLMGGGDNGPPASAGVLAARALDMVNMAGSQDDAEPGCKRAALAARIMRLGRIPLTVPQEMADGARANLVSLVGDVASLTGTSERSLREREAAILKLANAHADLVILNSVLRQAQPDGACTDRDLVVSALDMVIAGHPDLMEKAAAGLLRDGQKPKKR